MRAILFFLVLALPAQAESPRVLADIAPLQSLAAQVMVGVGAPDQLVTGNEDPHHMSMRPSQARALLDADLVIWIGPAMTPWLTPALEARGGATLTLAPDLVEGTDDPHLWLDPANARRWLLLIAEALASVDPDNAEVYNRNAEVAAAQLTDLTLQILSLLADHRDAKLITAHAAWGYFAEAFGVRIAGSIREDDHASPGARHLSDLRNLVTEGTVDCVLSEGPETEDLIATVIGDTPTRWTTAHPLGPTIPSGPDFYATHMLGVATAIADCVSPN